MLRTKRPPIEHSVHPAGAGEHSFRKTERVVDGEIVPSTSDPGNLNAQRGASTASSMSLYRLAPIDVPADGSERTARTGRRDACICMRHAAVTVKHKIDESESLLSPSS